MIKLAEFEYNWQDFLRLFGLFLFAFIGFWNASFVLIPLLFIIILFIIFSSRSAAFRSAWLPHFTWLDALVGSLLILELFNFLFSIYPPNSLPGIGKIIFFISIYYILRIFLQKTKYRTIFFTGMGIYAFILSLGAFFTFLFLQTALHLEGWDDASDLKGLYSPYGLLNNEWATLALCLLPFPLLCAIYFQKSKTILIISILAFALVNASVLVSFSRGAYVALAFFWIIMMSAILYFKLLSLATFIRYITITGLLLLLFIIPIRVPFSTTLAMNKTVSQQRSTAGRVEIVKNSFCQAKGHLIVGLGNNNYPIVNNLCKTDRIDQGYSGFTNNTYLQILLEKGIVGVIWYALLFISLFTFIIKTALKHNNSTDKLNIMIFGAGLATLAVRELFFSTLLYSQGVLLLTAIMVSGAISFQTVRIRDNRVWILLGSIIIIISSWFLYQNNKIESAASAAATSVTQWQLEKIEAAQKNIQKAIQSAPGVAPYHALQGLTAMPRQTHWDSITWNEPSSASALQPSISAFEKALRLNPNDAGYHFNLGWLHYWKNHNDTARIFNYLYNALALEPNASEYQIGTGLLLEVIKGDTAAAFSHYKRALCVSPELLDSPFFMDLQKRNFPFSERLVKEAMQDLKDQLNRNYNTILAARFSKLLLQTDDTIASEKILTQVVQDLPNLNRPYYYLAFIALNKKDTTLAINLLSKSAYLENSDYLPPLALGNLYYNKPFYNKNTARNAIQYYKQAVRNWLDQKTLNSSHAAIRYRYSTNVNNDLIVPSLLYYCNTSFDTKEILHRIAQLYQQIGESKLHAYYKKLAPEQLLLQDIK